MHAVSVIAITTSCCFLSNYILFKEPNRIKYIFIQQIWYESILDVQNNEIYNQIGYIMIYT